MCLSVAVVWGFSSTNCASREAFSCNTLSMSVVSFCGRKRKKNKVYCDTVTSFQNTTFTFKFCILDISIFPVVNLFLFWIEIVSLSLSYRSVAACGQWGLTWMFCLAILSLWLARLRSACCCWFISFCCSSAFTAVPRDSLRVVIWNHTIDW